MKTESSKIYSMFLSNKNPVISPVYSAGDTWVHCRTGLLANVYSFSKGFATKGRIRLKLHLPCMLLHYIKNRTDLTVC